QEAVEPLCQGLLDRDAGMRRLVAETLGKLKAQEAVPALVDACQDRHPDVRQAALVALSRLECEELPELLLAACEDGDVQVRETAVGLLAGVENSEGLQVLVAATHDDMAQVRETAIRSLAEIGGPEAFAALVEARSDEDYRVSKTAVEALGRFGEEALEPLQEALEDDGLPDQAAILGLEEVGGPAVEILLSALGHKRLPARRAAANALVRLYVGDELGEREQQLILDQEEIVALYADAVVGGDVERVEEEE
ncbi:MAG: HEAT repeat domain-containing protein, partial [Anaerolineaceae bacterium]